MPLILSEGFGKDYLSGSTFVLPLFQGVPPPGVPLPPVNLSQTGAPPDRLEDLGYEVTSVPSVDEEIAACLPQVGQAQFECWARLDQVLTEQVVPIVPYLAGTTIRIVSERVGLFSFDQFTTLPALDRIALAPGSG